MLRLLQKYASNLDCFIRSIWTLQHFNIAIVKLCVGCCCAIYEIIHNVFRIPSVNYSVRHWFFVQHLARFSHTHRRPQSPRIVLSLNKPRFLFEVGRILLRSNGCVWYEDNALYGDSRLLAQIDSLWPLTTWIF